MSRLVLRPRWIVASMAVFSELNMCWRGGRAAECTGLENQQGLIALRGFKSHPLRHISYEVLICLVK